MGSLFYSKSNQNKWTNHGILQHMGFYPPTENPNVMMRENNHKTKSSEYIFICQGDLYILMHEKLRTEEGVQINV